MDASPLILLLQLATTLPMTGLIWFVQVSHYPLFAAVDPAAFGSYESRHRTRTSIVVGPLMLIEAATTVLLFGGVPSFLTFAEAVAGAALLLTIWVSTAVLQVPCHHRLSQGFDERAWRRLVWSNWIRTAAWTARAVLLLGVVSRQLEGMR